MSPITIPTNPTPNDKAKAIVSLIALGLQVAILFGAPVTTWLGWITAHEAAIATTTAAGLGLVQAYLPAPKLKP